MQTQSSAHARASRNSAQAAQASWKQGSCSAHQGCTHQGQKSCFPGQPQLQEITGENHFYLHQQGKLLRPKLTANKQSFSPVPLPHGRHCCGSVHPPHSQLDVGTTGTRPIRAVPARPPLVPDHGAPAAPLLQGWDKEQLLRHQRQFGWEAQVSCRLILW